MNFPSLKFVYAVTIFGVVNPEPFFGLYIQGGFKMETDISSVALSITASFNTLTLAIGNLNKKIPLSTLVLNDAADGVNALYNGITGPIKNFTNSLGISAADSKTGTTVLFDDIIVSQNYAQQFVKNAPDHINKIRLVALKIGQTLTEAFEIVADILKDLSASVDALEKSLNEIRTNGQISSAVVHQYLNRYQTASMIAALNVFQSQIGIVRGQLDETISLILSCDNFMSLYTSTLTSTFASLDSSLSNAYNVIMKSSDWFQQQISSALTQLITSTETFNSKINSCNDDIIGANATAITTTTREFIEFFKYYMEVVMSNSEEKFNDVAHMTTDSVQNAARDTLFNAYQMLDNAMRNPPAANSCVDKFLNPLVQFLSFNVPTMGYCMNSLNAQSVASDQISVLKTLITDRMYYVNSRNNAMFGITIYSDASIRRAAVLKLLARTSFSNVDIQQPALAAAYSIFAQLVSNFNSLQNRVVMCLTLKSVEYSTQVISASNGYFSCIKST